MTVNMKHVALVGGLVAATAALAGLAYAEEAPTAEFLGAALADQLQRTAIEVGYEYGFEGRADSMARFRYVRTRWVQYLSTTLEGAPAFAWFDRAARTLRLSATDRGLKKGLVTDSKRSTPLSLASVADPVLYNLPADELAHLIAGGTVSQSPQDIDGHQCWRVDLTPGVDAYRTHKYTIWVDPDVGFCPRLIEERRESVVFLTVSFSEYAEIDAQTWFPMHIRWVAQSPGAEDSISVAHVSAARVVPESITQMLDIAFPSGTEVEDRILDAEYTVP